MLYNNGFFNDGDLLEEMEFAISFNEDESVNEVSVLESEKDKFSLHATPDGNYNLGEGEAYFKWVNSISFSKASEICRIRFTSATYVDHRDSRGKTVITLSSKQKKSMIKMLQSRVSDKDKNNAEISNPELFNLINNGWMLLIYYYNKYTGHTEDEMLKHLDLREPREKLPRNLVRLTIPMPDYMQL